MLDKEKWSIEDLLRYSALLKKQLDAQVLPECALSDDEVRQLEKYRLGIGITPYVDTPRPVVTDEVPSSTDAVPARTSLPDLAGAHQLSTPEHVEPEACPYCGGRCVGEQHHAYPIAHWHDPIEAERRRFDLQAREEHTRRPCRVLNITPPEY